MFTMREGKVHKDVVDCKDLIPSACGDVGIPNIGDGECTAVHFTGTSDVSVNQGENCIDLTEGVHAYDGSGAEIPFTVSPATIDCCKVGEYEVTYTAIGIGSKMLPTVCIGKPPLHITDCGMASATEKRIITVEPYGVVCESKVCCASAVC